MKLKQNPLLQRTFLTSIFFLTTTLIKFSQYYQTLLDNPSLQISTQADTIPGVSINRTGSVAETDTIPIINGEMQKIRNDESCRYIADIHAPSSIIWEILNNYDTQVRFRLLNEFVHIQFNTVNTFYPETNVLECKLDKNKKHNVRDFISSWHVESQTKHQSDWSRVSVSVDLVVLSLLPTFANENVNDKLMIESLKWLKIEAEQYWKDKKRNIFSFFNTVRREKKQNQRKYISHSETIVQKDSINMFLTITREQIISWLWQFTMGSLWTCSTTFLYFPLFNNGLDFLEKLYNMKELYGSQPVLEHIIYM